MDSGAADTRLRCPTCSSSDNGVAVSAFDALDDRGDPLPDTDAHRRQAVPAAGASQLVGEHRDETAAAHAEGMAERDGTAIDVHLGRVETELIDADERLRRERL